MTRNPKSVRSGAALSDAWDTLAGRKISELPVLDAAGRPLGLVDITDVLGLSPPQEALKKKIEATRKTRVDGPHVIPFRHG
jgi:arabinose-5-phosphate isomerase